jgi:hypothetical protein
MNRCWPKGPIGHRGIDYDRQISSSEAHRAVPLGEIELVGGNRVSTYGRRARGDSLDDMGFVDAPYGRHGSNDGGHAGHDRAHAKSLGKLSCSAWARRSRRSASIQVSRPPLPNLRRCGAKH